MEKPRVFANPINKKLNNSQEVFYEGKSSVRESIDINKKINEIFNSSHHVYKSKVEITTNNKSITCEIVGKTSNNLLTLDGNVIRIRDIIDIKKI